MTDKPAVLFLIEQDGWLESYDPDGGDPAVAYPTGTFAVTSNPARAMVFPDGAEALRFWRQPSTRTPLRPDGAANRPLTAFTVAVQPVPGAAEVAS
jgi:hypothetical protein